ncbi:MULTISPECIES: GNAT family N-acetyltransferase [unclassified Achromobacter]|uniref:GNAT family N-acetyltransferase n=1 Tax=unclassified Achromobacter TaxID=2626865 RepID=UPI000B518492|nr:MULTISPECIES: GNAT family N-acetyltransferase [unclassified Achromobacter]OWT70317.1 GNAT family N-acetyltransferase [Achromobacter sp. HZ34]OWT71857.1 GNAT family N-acetyltransferase [Achromobacter sp. HZ28]
MTDSQPASDPTADSDDPRLTVTRTLATVDPAQWDALAGPQPFLSHAFLSALHDTGCAAPATGWVPYYLILRRAGALVGAMPLYVKTHSRGEYVFDQAWAEAFERHGLDYYPKLLAAVPFTPVSGPRLLARTHADRVLLARGAVELTQSLKLSSLHVLFPQAEDQRALEEAGYLVRQGVQFHWEDAAYGNFDAFLAALSHDKRKKIRQDRKKVAAAGITFRWLSGAAIDDDALSFFHACYVETYRNHWSSPYLTLDFFQRLREQLPDALVLILACRDGAPVAAALNMTDGEALYGRHWGAMEVVPGLHFETCYLQGIEYCLAHGLGRFEGGAQGEHKIARGLLPTPTCSAHWITDRRFAEAIADFLQREGDAMTAYREDLEGHTPFRQAQGHPGA